MVVHRIVNLLLIRLAPTCHHQVGSLCLPEHVDAPLASRDGGGWDEGGKGTVLQDENGNRSGLERAEMVATATAISLFLGLKADMECLHSHSSSPIMAAGLYSG